MTVATEPSVTIRCLATWEIPQCVPFGEAFHKEMQLPGQFIGDVFINSWTNLLETHNADILTLWKDFTLIGGLGDLVSPDIYDARIVATEMFWFIDKDHRHGTGPVRLIKAFEMWGEKRGAVESRMVHLVTCDDEPREQQFERLYAKLGYRQIEKAWLKPLNIGGS